MRQLLFVITIFFISCSGSEVYRGTWKAMDSDGTKLEIVFNAKTFVLKDSIGETKAFDYSQNSVNINNSIKTYGIQLGDGRKYQIHFPKANNESVALIRDESGQTMYIISRQEYITINDVYKFE